MLVSILIHICTQYHVVGEENFHVWKYLSYINLTYVIISSKWGSAASNFLKTKSLNLQIKVVVLHLRSYHSIIPITITKVIPHKREPKQNLLLSYYNILVSQKANTHLVSYNCFWLWMSVCMCECLLPRLLITSGMMWYDIDHIWSVESVLWFIWTVVTIISGCDLSIYTCLGKLAQ